MVGPPCQDFSRGVVFTGPRKDPLKSSLPTLRHSYSVKHGEKPFGGILATKPIEHGASVNSGGLAPLEQRRLVGRQRCFNISCVIDQCFCQLRPVVKSEIRTLTKVGS